MIIGLTGGSGCGKTTVAKIIKDMNGFIIDADFIAHNIIKNGQPAYNEILQNFEGNILSNKGEIDRKILGDIVFSDKSKLKLLNSITHKYILKEIKTQIYLAEEKGIFDYIVLDAPLLIETDLHKIVDKVWVVYSSISDRIERLKKRDNTSEEILFKRIKNQTPFEKISQFADFIIYNENENDLRKIVENQLKKGV